MRSENIVKQTKIFYILILVGGMLLLGNVLSSSAEIYRWKNSNGQVHYSTKPPSHPVAGQIEVKRDNRWYSYTGDSVFQNTTTKSKKAITYTTSSPGSSDLYPTRKQEQAVVPYNKQQSVIIIQATINQQLTRPFAVDTGATYTVISPEIAEALHIRPNPKDPLITLQTANGRIEVPLVNLKSVTVGGMETQNVTAAIHQVDDSSNIFGLLGLNFLNRFQMTVDSTNNQLIFKPIANDCATAREYLEQGRMLRNNSEKEASYYRKAISLCPELIEAYYYLGAIYIQQQNSEQAVELHHKLVRMQPNEPEAHFRLGISYMLKRDFQQAKKEFRKTLQLNANHQQAAEYLKQLKNL